MRVPGWAPACAPPSETSLREALRFPGFSLYFRALSAPIYLADNVTEG